jgi:hypothetical protein
MATAPSPTYRVASGAQVNAGRWPGGRAAGGVTLADAVLSGSFAVDDGVPAWLSGVAVNEWVQISGTSWASGLPSVDGDGIDAWGTLVLIDGTGTLVSPANGGHGDSVDNGVYSIDLLTDAPSWATRIAASTSTQSDVEYYADGKPTSRHGYAYAHYISQRSRVMMFGARGMAGNGNDGLKVASHTVSGTWTWDAEGTFTASPAGWGTARDPLTGNMMTNSGRLWTESTAAWSTLGLFTGGWRYPVAFDSARSQFFALQWGDGGPDSGSTGIVAQKFDRATGAGTTITFNASSAYTQWLADGHRYAGMDYDSTNDCFLFYSGQTFSGGSVATNVTQRVYKITPNSGSTWDMEILSVTGATPAAAPSGGAGINGRWKFIPELDGFMVLPNKTSNIYFLRTA